jgi:peptidoglycan/LPS O-acetylase OafA/YrhL
VNTAAPHQTTLYRPDIDGLRAVAVLVVVMFHAWPALLPGGYLGVDVFFVISGFLITGIIVGEMRKGRFTFRRFYARRARRILPALMVVLLAGLGLGWYALLAEELEALGRHTVGATFFLANFQLMADVGYFDPAAETKPLLHLWSLGIEEQFYLTFPLLLWLAWRWRTSLAGLIAGIGVASVLLHVWIGLTDSTAAFYLPVTRAWELMAGAFLAATAGRSGATPRAGGAPGPHLYSLAGGALIAAAVLLVSVIDAPPLASLLIAVAGSALLIFAGPDAVVNQRLLALPPLVAIGLISYPLYLWHWLLISFSRIYFGREGAVEQLPLVLTLSFGLAWATYQFVERPVRTGALRGTAVAGLLATLASVVVVAGSVAWSREGLPERRTARQLALAEFVKSPHEPFRDDTCYTLLGSFDVDPDGCRSSSTAAPAVVLLGDSHAHQYYNSLAKQLAGTPVLHLGRWSCLPFSSRKHQSERCQKSIALSRDYVISQRSVSTVVMAGYWAYLMAGGFGDNNADYRVAARFDPAEAQVFLRTGNEVIAALLNAGKRVVLILDTPNLNFNIQRCVFDPVIPLGRPRTPPPCALDRRDLEARNAPYDTVMTQLAAGHPGLKVFDPRSVLCDNSACSAVRDGRSLYFDSDHLSSRGADLVIERLIASGMLER